MKMRHKGTAYAWLGIITAFAGLFFGEVVWERFGVDYGFYDVFFNCAWFSISGFFAMAGIIVRIEADLMEWGLIR